MELTGNVSGMINLGGGGGGSTVEVTPILTSGEHIADIEVDGVTSELYAPASTAPTEVEVTPIVTSGDHIADIEVDGVTSELYAPSKSVVNYSTTPQRTGRKWIDNSDVLEVVLTGEITSTSQTFDLSDLNIKEVVSIRGVLNGVNTAAGYQLNFPYYESNTYYSIFTKMPSGDMFLSSSSAIVSNYNNFNIILEYTEN